jgi:hypothetical protein
MHTFQRVEQPCQFGILCILRPSRAARLRPESPEIRCSRRSGRVPSQYYDL